MAWDQSSGNVGSKVDSSLGGGSTAFSIQFATAYLPVAGPNHPPTATNLQQRQTYVEGADSVALADVVVRDPDMAEQITATLVLDRPATGVLTAGSGRGERYDSSTGTWTVTGLTGQVNEALARVAFQPAEENDVDASIRVSIADGGENGATVLTGSVTLDVTPVNDAPVMRTIASRTFEGGQAGDQFGRRSARQATWMATAMAISLWEPAAASRAAFVLEVPLSTRATTGRCCTRFPASPETSRLPPSTRQATSMAMECPT